MNKRKHDQVEEEEKGSIADEVLKMMPKTDKQVRHERRIKANEGRERKLARLAKKSDLEAPDFQEVPNDHNDNDDDDDDDDSDKEEDEATRAKRLKARALIKAGMGTIAQDDNDDKKKGFEIVPSSALPVMDTCQYDSDHEDYDDGDYARTLALGSLFRYALRTSHGVPNL